MRRDEYADEVAESKEIKEEVAFHARDQEHLKKIKEEINSHDLDVIRLCKQAREDDDELDRSLRMSRSFQTQFIDADEDYDDDGT